MSTFGYTLESVTVDPATGRPAPGVTVYGFTDPTGGDPLAQTLSDLDGGFGFTGLDDALSTLWVGTSLTGDRFPLVAREALDAKANAADVAASLATKANAATVGALTTRVDTTETRVGTVENELVGRLSSASLSSTYALKSEAGGGPVVAPPSGFAFSVLDEPTIRRLGGGRFYTDLDLTPLRPAAGVTYYVSPTGSDANSGTSAAAPITLPGALGKADVGTIVYAPGEYLRNTHTTAQTSKSINHLASGPGVKVTGWNSPSSTVWTLTSGSIYQTSRSATAQVVDVTNRTSWGDATVYEKKTDLASVTGPGQWAIVGSTVYVWPIGGTNMTVDANRWQLRLGLSATYTGLNITGGTSYVRGIDFEGQAYGVAISAGRLIMEDCTVRYSLTDGIPVSGGSAILRRCTVSSNATDGMSYSNAAEFIEVDVTSHHNGNTAGAATNNATTAHGSVRGIRVGGDYDAAGGPVVADVNSARTWNLGCRAGDSLALPAQNQSYRIDAVGYDANPAVMWLDECSSDTADYAFKVTGNGAIYVHAHRRSNVGATDPDSTGTVDFYDAA